ncbi:MAG TPA: FtsX-like permease family protein [Acidimicrobiales bacterium]|nr:FtsX-like permease family protein [Acidimicrobiales bacterium]
MLAVTVADLVQRARQFLIAVVGTAVVLGVALVVAGMAQGFTAEVSQTVHGFGADSLVLSRAAEARISAFADFPSADAALVATSPGVRRADPILLDPNQVARWSGHSATVYIAGVTIGGIGNPTELTSGHPLAGPEQAVADSLLGVGSGGRLVVGGLRFDVVGTVSGRSLLGGIPLVYVPLGEAQQLAVHGRPYITGVLTTGFPRRVPSGLQAESPDQVDAATVAQMSGAIQSLRASEWLMWAVAVIIVAALLYVVALERRRDFAVLKALGASTAALFAGLVLEAILATLVASALGLLLSVVLSPLMAEQVDVPTLAYLTLPLIAMALGVVASVAAVRQIARVDPASAFS